MIKTLSAAAFVIAAAITPASADTDFFRLDPMDRGMIMHIIASQECPAISDKIDVEMLIEIYASIKGIRSFDAAVQLGTRASGYTVELEKIDGAIPKLCQIVGSQIAAY